MAGTAEVGVAETYDATVFMLITRTILVGARLVFTIYVVWYGICIRTELHESEGTQAPGNVCPIPFVPMIGLQDQLHWSVRSLLLSWLPERGNTSIS